MKVEAMVLGHETLEKVAEFKPDLILC